jgi:lipoprotein-releasing system permease protein
VVADKTSEIGILRAVGLTARSIGRVFVLQGAIIGITGTSIGVVLGLVLAYVIDTSGMIRIDPAIYFIDHLPVHIQPLDVLIVVVLSLAIAIAATIHPSRTAAGLTPVEAIRND